MKLRILLVDDESLARERLRHLLRDDAAVEIVGECADGASAIEATERLAPDLLLLDVQMPSLDGFDVIRAVAGLPVPPAIVLVTAFDEHAVRAFEARALDYLLKPTSRARLKDALSRVRERRTAGGAALPPALLELLAERKQAPGRVRRLAVKNGERTRFVPVAELDWIEAAGNYALLHVGRETHVIRETMASLEEQLGGGDFLRVSRSAIVNLARITEILTPAPGEHWAVLAGGARVGIARPVREVEERLRGVRAS